MQETITAVITTEEKAELKALNHPLVNKILEQDEWRKAIVQYADQIEIAELFVAHMNKHGDVETKDDWEDDLATIVERLDKTAISKKTYDDIMVLGGVVMTQEEELALKLFETEKRVLLYADDEVSLYLKIKSVADGEVEYEFSDDGRVKTCMADEFWEDVLQHKRGTNAVEISEDVLEEL
jgi:hypothetical protein